MLKKQVSIKAFILIGHLSIALLSGCMSGDEANITAEKLDMAFSFEEAAVNLPSPASVQLDKGGRFQLRYKGNVDYLRYQYEYYGEEMLAAFASPLIVN
jgi:hypothetical protein